MDLHRVREVGSAKGGENLQHLSPPRMVAIHYALDFSGDLATFVSQVQGQAGECDGYISGAVSDQLPVALCSGIFVIRLIW